MAIKKAESKNKKASVERIAAPVLASNMTEQKPETLMFEDEGYYTDLHLVEGVVDEVRAKSVCFKGCLFENVTFVDVDLDSAEWINCVFRRCDFSGIRAVHGTFMKCHFEGCKMRGAILSEGVFTDVVFEGVMGSMLTVRFCEFRNFRIENCKLDQSDFQESRFTKGTIEGTDLTKASFVRVPLAGLDFTTNTTDGLQVELADIKGLVVTADQAFEMIRLLGVVVA